eukprot:5408360-Prymnesium_polylepis.2
MSQDQAIAALDAGPFCCDPCCVSTVGVSTERANPIHESATSRHTHRGRPTAHSTLIAVAEPHDRSTAQESGRRVDTTPQLC